MRQISVNRLLSDFGYYAANLLVIKSKMRGICRFDLNLPQKILYYGIPPEIRQQDRRFQFVMLDRGWQECERQGIPIRQYILKARQEGISTEVEGYIFSKVHTRRGTNALVVAHDDEATSGIFQMTRMFYSYLPDQLKPRVKNSNVKEILFQDPNGPGGLNSSIRTQTAGWKNIGRSKMLHHLHLCLSGETLIEIENGFTRRIDTIRAGDTVRTHTGKLAKVSFVTKRTAESVSAGGLTLKITPWLSGEELHLTPDHALWSREGWKKAKDFKVGDEVAYPIKEVTSEISSLDIYAKERPRPQGGGCRSKIGSILLDREFGFFVGYYLAEGSVAGNKTSQGRSACRVTFSHHSKEFDFADRARRAVSDFTSKVVTKNRSGTFSSWTTLYGAALAQTIQREFGEKDEKVIPEWVFRAGRDFLAGIWEGYCAGDGSKADPGTYVAVTSIRRHLLVQLRYIVAALGLGWPGIYKKKEGFVDGRGWKCKDAWTLGWSSGNRRPYIRKWKREGNMVWVRVKSIEESQTDYVYDLEIDHPDHSFVTAAGAVKNSEVCFWPDPEAVTDGLFETVPQGPGTSIIIETTAQLLNRWGYEAWFKAKEAWQNNQIRDFDPVFLPWFILPEYVLQYPDNHEFTQEDKEFKDYYGLNWKQVYWYNRKLASFEFRHPGRGRKFMKTEYPCNDDEAWQSSGESAFPEETIQMIHRHQVRDPDLRFSVGNNGIVRDSNGYLKVWERPQTGVQYAIGVDTAHGVRQDYTVISVLAHPGYRQVAEWASNTVGPREVAPIIQAIAEWYNEAVVAVEVNGGSGMLVNSTLMETYGNLYRWEYFDSNSRAETKKVGWETTHRSKVMLIDYANSLFSPEVKALVRSGSVADQMQALRMVVYPNGSGADYQFTFHTGDHLMAWLIACMCMWRKIARFDIDGEMSGSNFNVPVDVDRPIHVNSDGSFTMHDEKGVDILGGNGEDEGGSGISKSWLCH